MKKAKPIFGQGIVNPNYSNIPHYQQNPPTNNQQNGSNVGYMNYSEPSKKGTEKINDVISDSPSMISTKVPSKIYNPPTPKPRPMPIFSEPFIEIPFSRITQKETLFINMTINNFPVKFHLFNQNITNPRDLKGFYGDMDEIVGKLTFLEVGYLSNDVQILKFKNTLKKNIVIKRCVINCTLESIEGIQQNTNKKEMEFLASCFEEYYISKIVSSHPAGLSSIDFQISLLIQNGLLLTEFVMEDGGIELGEFCLNRINYPKYDEIILKFMKESAEVLRFMQKMKLKYGDLKSQNFLVDEGGKLKIIDFNISQIGGLGCSTGSISKKEIKGYTLGYVSPEIYNKVQNITRGSGLRHLCEGIDCWISDIYSWGMLFLLLLKGVKNESELRDLDVCKINEEHHKFILSKIWSIHVQNPQLKEKVKFILYSCLQFQPEKRVCLKVLDDIMKNIEKYSLDIIKKKIENKGIINGSGINSVDQAKLEDLKIKYNELQHQNQYIVKENMQMKEDLKGFKSKISECIKLNPNRLYDLNKICESIIYRLKTLKDKIQLNKKNNQEIFFLIKNSLLDGESIQLQNKAFCKNSLIKAINTVLSSEKINNPLIDFHSNSNFENDSLLYSKFIEYFKQIRIYSKHCSYNGCPLVSSHFSIDSNNLQKYTLRCIFELSMSLKRERKNIIDESIGKNKFSWGFYNKMYKKKEIFYIISCIMNNQFVREIDFGSNIYFDEDCAYQYID